MTLDKSEVSVTSRNFFVSEIAKMAVYAVARVQDLKNILTNSGKAAKTVYNMPTKANKLDKTTGLYE